MTTVTNTQKNRFQNFHENIFQTNKITVTGWHLTLSPLTHPPQNVPPKSPHLANPLLCLMSVLQDRQGQNYFFSPIQNLI